MVLVRLAQRLVFVAVVFGLMAHFVPGIHVHDGFASLLWVALLFTVVNTIVGPILRLFSLPVIVLTLGLFLLVINGMMILVASSVVRGFHVYGMVPAFWGAVVLALLGMIFRSILKDA